jgi:hypothetical protein
MGEDQPRDLKTAKPHHHKTIMFIRAVRQKRITNDDSPKDFPRLGIWAIYKQECENHRCSIGHWTAFHYLHKRIVI